MFVKIWETAAPATPSVKTRACTTGANRNRTGDPLPVEAGADLV
jgi:hypothetical protein